MNNLFGRGKPQAESPNTKPASPSKLTRKAPLSIPRSLDSVPVKSSPNPPLIVSSSACSHSPSFTSSSGRLIPTKLNSVTSNATHIYARPGHLSQSYSYSDAETYWAARAIRSETLLAARTTHHGEIRTLLTEADVRKAREIAQVKREHDARHAKLEIVIIALSISFAILALSLIYLLRHPRPKEKPRLGWLSGPHHFTIPIFSPFTSVVETEASFLGARSIMLLIIVLGAVVYGLLRRWLNMRRT